MKKYYLLLLASAIWLTTVAQSNSDILKEANSLIAERKYDSAFKKLAAADPNNKQPELVLLKEDIVLNYFLTSINHQLFGLKDLNPDEEISNLRGKDGIYSMYSFPINEILDTLIKLYPDNPKLRKGLADYYYEAHLKYGDNWIIGPEELLNLIKTNYGLAIEKDIYDHISFYALGYISLVEGENEKAIPYFNRSIELNENFASAYYNLAYAHLNQNNTGSALINAKKGLDLYTDPVYKGDAARMIAIIYSELDSVQSSINYYELSNKIDPDNYYTLGPLLNLYLQTKNENYHATTEDFFKLGPDNPTIYNDLFSIYESNEVATELIGFLESKLSEYKGVEAAYANINFYLGRAYFDIDKKKAGEYLKTARNEFAKIFDKNHPVFKVIDDGLKQLY